MDKGEGMSGAERIAAERKRQVEQEGWTPEHDDEHVCMEMTLAAVSYAFEALDAVNDRSLDPETDPLPSAYWPWDDEWFKPSDDPIRNLEKAGALIAAEIDRLERMREREAVA